MNKSMVIDAFTPTGAPRHHGVSRLAGFFGVTASAVYKWPEQLDFQQQCAVEVITRRLGMEVMYADFELPRNRLSERNRRRIEAQRDRERWDPDEVA